MSEHSRVRLATEEDLLRDFGPSGLLIGSPVRPTPPSDATAEPTPPANAPSAKPDSPKRRGERAG
jgi:hypothetical protein